MNELVQDRPLSVRMPSESAPFVWRWVRFVFFGGILLLVGVNCGWGQWTEPELFPVEHGTAIRGPWISNDDLRMYAAFTGYIFVAERAAVDSPWTPFHTVGDHINSGIRQESPCESPTGDTLYFMSYGRPEPSFGLYDIYYTIRTDSGWFGPIVNCGPTINSEFMEWSVGISRDGTKLLIAADRIPGHGGMDVYYSDKQQDGTWGILQDFGPHVNTWLGQEHPTLSVDNNVLFYYSVDTRNGDIAWSRQIDDVWQPAQAVPAPVTSLEWTEADPCLASDSRTLYYLSDVGDNNDFQLYSSIDTSILSTRRVQPIQFNVTPTLFCFCDSQRTLKLTIVGVRPANDATFVSFDLLGRESYRTTVTFNSDERALKGNVRIPESISSGIYIATLQIGSIRLHEKFQLIY